MQRAIKDFLFESSGFLILGTILALGWANSAADSYHEAQHLLHFAVKDVGMAFFFLIVGKEVFEAIFLKSGALHGRQKFALPAIAVVGGMLVPAGVYVLTAYLFNQVELLSGWAIPCATDIAFSLLVLKRIYPSAKHPAVVFLLAVAILDDFGGLAIIAAFYSPTPPDLFTAGLFVGLGLICGVMLRSMKVRSFWPYLLITGGCSWWGFYAGGLHAALGLLPCVLVMPHAESDLGFFAEGEDERHDTLNQMEHFFKNPVEIVLFFFGLVNAGVVFSSFGAPTTMVLSALLIGKLFGITLFAYIGVKLFRCELPEGVTLQRDLPVLSMAAAIGFTVALFVAVATGITGDALDALKMGALLSFLAFPLTLFMARLYKVGRFAEDATPNEATT